jgi:hypothetical protein
MAWSAVIEDLNDPDTFRNDIVFQAAEKNPMLDSRSTFGIFVPGF